MRYRAIDQNASLPGVEASRNQMFAARAQHVMLPDEAYHQGDAPKEPVDFFAPLVLPDRLNRIFSTMDEEEYSAAREVIAAMLRSYEDADAISSNISRHKTGRAWCRERVWQYVSIQGVAQSLKKKTT